MIEKSDLLLEIARLSQTGELTKDEVMKALKVGNPSIVDEPEPPVAHIAVKPVDTKDSPTLMSHFNASIILYYIGAIIIYAAIYIFLGTAWDALGAFGHVFFTLGLGAIFWAVAKYLYRSDSEQSQGIGDAILLLGSASITAGVYVMLYEVVKDFENSRTLVGLLLLATLMVASLHYGMDFMVRKTLMAFMASAAVVTSYLLLVGLIVFDTIDSVDFWGLVATSAGILVIGIGAMYRKYQPDRKGLRNLLWAIGGFSVLASLFTLSVSSDVKALWQLIYIAVLYGAFVASVKFSSKNFLYSAAFWLFIFIMYIAFYYFGNGLGAAFALMIGGFGIIGSGVLVQSIKKKYFKDPA